MGKVLLNADADVDDDNNNDPGVDVANMGWTVAGCISSPGLGRRFLPALDRGLDRVPTILPC